MKMAKDLTNQRFSKLVAIRKVENDKYNHAQWMCKCDCGNEKIVLQSSLVSNRTRSCGCYYTETRKTSASTHGQSKTRLFRIWAGLFRRCYNPKEMNYAYYGGRGITVCEDWKKFEPFQEWALSNGYSDELTIDRIDANKGYSPDNCRWADRYTQANNTRRNHYVTIDGETKTLTEWERIYGISNTTVFWRINHGWSDVEALTTPK